MRGGAGIWRSHGQVPGTSLLLYPRRALDPHKTALKATSITLGRCAKLYLSLSQSEIVAPIVSSPRRQQHAVRAGPQILLVNENSAARQLKTETATERHVVNDSAQRGARERFAGGQFHLVS